MKTYIEIELSESENAELEKTAKAYSDTPEKILQKVIEKILTEGVPHRRDDKTTNVTSDNCVA